MTPRPTNIILNAERNHSITYDPSTDSVTAHLPNALPIDRVPNKPKLMLLIHFAIRDMQKIASPRKIDPDTTVEQRIVESIVFQFSNYAQAIRTLNEYSMVGDQIDLSKGLGATRVRKDDGKRDKIAAKMTITREIS